MISLQSSTHSSQMYTPGPAISCCTCFWDLPQKEHLSRSALSPMRAMRDLPLPVVPPTSLTRDGDTQRHRVEMWHGAPFALGRSNPGRRRLRTSTCSRRRVGRGTIDSRDGSQDEHVLGET